MNKDFRRIIKRIIEGKVIVEIVLIKTTYCTECCHEIDDCYNTVVKEATVSDVITYSKREISHIQKGHEKVYIYIDNRETHENTAYCCDECEETYIEKQFYVNGEYVVEKVDNLFNNEILSHGIATGYSGSIDQSDLSNRSKWLFENSSKQICCSHKSQRIGAIGFYIKGKNQFVSNRDVWSSLDTNGNRVFDKIKFEKYLVKTKDKYSLDKWDHVEHIVSDFTICGIWIKDWALEEFGSEYERVREQYGLKVAHIIKKRRAS